MNMLTKNPMEYTFDHKQEDLDGLLNTVEDSNDRNCLGIFLVAIYDLIEGSSGLFPVLLEGLVDTEFSKVSEIAEYLLHSLPIKTVEVIIMNRGLELSGDIH